MNNEIYIIKTNPSDWESHPEIVGYKVSKESAEEYVKGASETYKLALAFQTEMWNIREAFGKTLPEIICEPTETITKWPKGLSQKDITPQMKEERETTQKRNHDKLVECFDKKRARNKIIANHMSSYENKFPSFIEFNEQNGMFSINEHLSEGEPFFIEGVSLLG